MKDQSGHGRLYKSNIRRKKNRGSQTTGKSKGIIARTIERYMCKHNRSWRHPYYEIVMYALTKKQRMGKTK